MPAPLETFVLGAVFGVSIAAPVGPIGILCIQRTLTRGWRSGVVSGLGAASADAMYGAVVAFGVTAISSLLLAYASPLRLVGGLLLIGLGVQTLRAPPATEPAGESSGRGLVSDYTTTLALTLSNPVTILAFVAIVTGYSVAVGSAVEAGALVAGVFLGSVAWWLLLAALVSRISARVTTQWLHWVNRAAGVVLLGFGIGALSGLR
ncbi:LysE family translocator [Haladaptatus sp. CMSO5]|uniref:LysE family translocator n=1 Tax=Haladaptatus sp. CMSO5 TaxID=3120514 RepID=UPI002FCDF4CE